MPLLETLRMALGGLRNNVMRSLLTILGVIIGVTSVIVMIAIGEGAQNQITRQIQSLGTNMLIVMPGRLGGGAGNRGAAGSAFVLDQKLVARIREETTTAVAVAPETGGSRSVSYDGTALMTSIIGVTPEYAQVRNLKLQSGEFFTEGDDKARRRVAIIGPSLAEELFGADVDPMGKEIRIGGGRYKVIGVTEAKGQSGMSNLDDTVYVPFQTAQRRIFGSTFIRAIYVQVNESASMDEGAEDLNSILASHIGDETSYSVRSQDEILNTAIEMSNTFTMLLAGIASVSLLVGGIGIMNIMLVSVTERIREIGLRKAIGARRMEIMLQFLLEAIVLSLVGGIIGVLLGAAGAGIASRLMKMPVLISPGAIMIALAFSVAVGLFFGVFPANKASLLHPIEALRHE